MGSRPASVGQDREAWGREVTDAELEALPAVTDAEVALRLRALAEPSIAAIVGDRWAPAPLPQGQQVTFPYVTTQEVGGPESETDLKGPVGLARTIVQVDVWAKTGPIARRLRELIRIAVHGKAWDASPMRVMRAEIGRGAGAPTFEVETGLHRRSFDVVLLHTEARAEGEL